MYTKGANMLHTLRQWVGNDQTWRSMLRGLNETFYHQTVTSAQVETYMAEQAGLNLTAFFDQYVRDTRIPVLEYIIQDEGLQYRWTQTVRGFAMPVKVTLGGAETWLYPSRQWKELPVPPNQQSLEADPNFYIALMKYH